MSANATAATNSSPNLSNFIGGFEKLDLKRKNWLVSEQQFKITLKQKEVWNHFDGSAKRPGTADPDKPTAAETKEIEAWDRVENLALYLLTLTVAPISYAKHKRKGNVAAVWGGIVAEFSSKTLLTRPNLHCDFMNMMNMKYTPGTDLHMEFDELHLS